MIIDTSVILAILLNEEARLQFNVAIEAAATVRLSTATYVETSIVIESRFGAAGLQDLDRFIEFAGIELVSVDTKQAKAARAAFSTYGKGRHPAQLNFGDCFSYALSWIFGEPLLFKGDDFSRTDIVPACPREFQ